MLQIGLKHRYNVLDMVPLRYCIYYQYCRYELYCGH